MDGFCQSDFFNTINSGFVNPCESIGKVFSAVILSAAKNLTRSVILNEVKDLMGSFALLRTGFVASSSSE